ncbi:type II toxin-antitoxin system HicB family antitoxin [Lactobacillus sp. W8089]|nr:type II toxin-antitoxin system HicB family antitoxin [Lactobacillus sp. W8089]
MERKEFIMKKEFQNVVDAYPVIISYDSNETEYPYFAHIVDLDSDTTGQSLEDVIKMARCAIGDEIIARQDEGLDVPKASRNVQADSKDDIVTYIDINVNKYRATIDNRTVKKTVTIPSYLNELGQEKGINFSEALTNTLREKLNI